MLKPAVLLAVPALFALGACSASDATPKQPIGVSGTSAADAPAGNTATFLPVTAKDALDAGNSAYRAKKFDLAIASYREAAIAAPAHAAPWFGVFMAASELKNTALADSAMARVKALSADPAALGAHAEAISTAPSSSAGQLPPGHPSIERPLPPGHPAPRKQPR